MARAQVLILLAIAVCNSATPAQQRRNSKFLERQEEFPTTSELPVAPYAAAGFRPGRAFNLPTEDEEARAAQNPPETTGIPANRYGPPNEAATTTVSPQEDETTGNPDSEIEDLARNTAATEKEAAAEIPDGLYYVQLPVGVEQLIVGVPQDEQARQNIKFERLVDQPAVIAANAPQSFSYVSQYQSW